MAFFVEESVRLHRGYGTSSKLYASQLLRVKHAHAKTQESLH